MRRHFLFALFAFNAVFLTIPVLAQDADPLNDCLAQAAGFNPGGNSCTANDIAIKQIIVGAVLDGCSHSGDTAMVVMDGEVEVSGGGTKYDIGIYLNIQGGSAFSAIDQCFRDFFDPSAIPTEGTPTGDADACNNAGGAAGSISTAVLGPIEIPCTEDGVTPNGIVDFSGCVSYVQNANGVNCQGVADAIPLNTSKCGCSTQDVPGLSLPELVLTKTCDLAQLTLGAVSVCTVTYTNNSSIAPADFHSFRDDYDQSRVQVTQIVSASSLPANGGDTAVDDGDIIVWTPGGTPAAAANIPPLGSGSMVYNLSLLPGSSEGQTIFNQVCAYWNDNSEPLCADYTHNVGPTAAVITAFNIAESDQGVVVQWRTSAETGTQGFQLERWDGLSGEFLPVGAAIATLESALQGSDYRVVDPMGSRDTRYRIVEVEIGDQLRVHKLEVTKPTDRVQSRTMVDLPAGIQRAVRQPDQAPQSMGTDGLAVHQLAANGIGNGTSERLVIEVAETGLQRVDIDVLASNLGLRKKGVRSRLNSARFLLSKDGQPVAWWQGQDKESLLFYGVYEDNLFSLTAPYRLDLEPGPTAASERVALGQNGLVDRLPTSREFEENRLQRVSFAESPEDDYWFWDLVGRSATKSFQIDVPSPVSTEGGQLSARFYGALVDPGAEIAVELNGVALGSATLTAGGTASATFAVPADVLIDGQNAIDVSVNGQVGAIAVDAFNLDFTQRLVGTNGAISFHLEQSSGVEILGLASPTTQILDVTDANHPVLLELKRGRGQAQSSFRGVLPAGDFLAVDRPVGSPTVRPYSLPLTHQNQAADELIVTHSSLLAGAEAHAQYRRTQGLRVSVMTAQQAFDLYTDSRPDPDAIRLLTQAVADVSGGDLQGLFLIGSGKLDPRDILGQGGNLVPAALVKASFGLVASDRVFVDFNADGVDEVAVGRLPAITDEQVFDYLEKVRSYEAYDGAWRQRDLLLADNTDSQGDYARDSNNFAAPLLRNPSRIFLGQTHDVSEARLALVDSWENGLRLMNYFGHGGVLTLAHEDLLKVSFLDALPSVESNPVLLALTCNIGRFDIPGFDGLGGELVLSPNGAAVVWSSAGLSVQTKAREMAANFLEILDAEPGIALGEAARRTLALEGAAGREIVLSFLGDPLLISQ